MAVCATALLLSGCGIGAPHPPTDLPWPESPAAIGYLSGGDITRHGTEDPQPIASIAKVITALVVLDAHPLIPGEHGPEIEITDDDVIDARTVVAADGIALSFAAGERLSEYDLLACALIASASDCSNILARFAYGTMGGYLDAATAWLAAHNLEGITVTDASGLDGGSRATTVDLVHLGRIALAHPVVAEIVARSDIVVARQLLRNTNTLVDVGFTGIKTGTDQRSALLFSRRVGAEIVIGVILNAENGAYARRAAVELTDALLQ